jgi:hypothetical protein
MNALTLSRQYFMEIARPYLQEAFPALYPALAAGLAGNGSECFGYDDEISRDHDWGVDFFIWLPEEHRDQVPALTAWKAALFDKHPPSYPRMRSEYGAHLGVMTAGDFYRSLVGFPQGPQTLEDWRRVPEENLAMAVNGEVFMDNAGAFTAVRRRLLEHYPEDLRLKKLAARCVAIAQTGQYNAVRCYRRGDYVTLRAVTARFTDNVISAVFLLNRVYKPYYKWAFRRMTELPVLGPELGPELTAVALSPIDDPESFELLDARLRRICDRLGAELKNQGLSSSDDWFFTSHAEEIRQKIHDPFLKSLPTQYE